MVNVDQLERLLLMMEVEEYKIGLILGRARYVVEGRPNEELKLGDLHRVFGRFTFDRYVFEEAWRAGVLDKDSSMLQAWVKSLMGG